MSSKQEYKKPTQIRAYFALAWYALRAQTRNPATFAFGFIFPVVFICIFGLIGGSTTKLTVGVPTNSDTSSPVVQVIEKQPILKIEHDDYSTLEKRLKQGKVAGIVEVNSSPKGSNVTLITTQANPQESGSLTLLLKGIVDESNLKIAHVTNPAISFNSERVSGRIFRYIDFALPGQIGFSLLSTAIFGTVFGLIYLKKAGVLKRMFATPTLPITILLAQGTSRLVMAMLQTILILGIGVIVFHFYLPNGIITFLQLLLLSAVGLTAFLGFGYFMAGLANDENSAGPLVNLITLPQFLLSGTFFSTDNFPSWLQPIANNLPLSYFNIAIRKITTEGGTLADAFPYMLGLIAWGCVMYFLAARTFKFE